MSIERPPAAFTRQLVESEAAADFPNLRRVPSSTVRRFLDYYSTLPEPEARSLRAALAERGALTLRPTPGVTMRPETADAYGRWTSAMLSERYHGLAYQPLRLAKNMVAADEWTIDSDAARAVAETKSASAALLRRLIKPVFRDRFGLVGENRRGGDWRYVREDGLLTVRLDFGGRTDQLRYSVTATDPASGYRVPLATVEGLLGLTGGWDWIEESGAQESVNLLAEFVETLAALPRQLALEGS